MNGHMTHSPLTLTTEDHVNISFVESIFPCEVERFLESSTVVTPLI
jgi:hypothetical protein